MSVGFDTVADSITPTHVKSVGGAWVPVNANQRIALDLAQHEELKDLRFELFKLHLRSRI